MLRSGQLCLLLILFLIPILFVPAAIDYQNSIVTFLKDMAFLLLAPLALFFAIGAWIQNSKRQGSQNSLPLLLPLFLLGLWIFIRLLQAPYPATAFREAHRWFAYLCSGAAAGLLAGDQPVSSNGMVFNPRHERTIIDLWNHSILRYRCFRLGIV